MSRLRKIGQTDLDAIAKWDLSSTDLLHWAGISNQDSCLKDIFSKWHQETFARAFAYDSGESLIGYAELWIEDHEIEIARVLVNPKFRRRGHGRDLTLKLLEKAKLINSNVWLRVHPENFAAITLYQSCDLEIASAAQQTEFNVNQSINYVWLRSI